MVPLPITQPVTSVAQETIPGNLTNQIGGNAVKENKINQVNNNVAQFQRPASQATSVKAEPGSAMGSIASASVANKVSPSITNNFIKNKELLYRKIYNFVLLMFAGDVWMFEKRFRSSVGLFAGHAVSESTRLRDR